MNTVSKITWLLLLLGILCFFTAITIRHSVSDERLLQHEAYRLQQKLLTKENIVQSLLKDKASLDLLPKDGKSARQFIENNRNSGINLLIYQQENLKFWTSYRTFPSDISKIKEGSTFIRLANGYYELIKKSSGTTHYLFLITIKTNYSIENQYLKNEIWLQLFDHKTLDIASFGDKSSAEIFNFNKEFLFGVKLSNNAGDNIFSFWQVWLWIAGVLLVSVAINWFGVKLVKKGHPIWATSLMFCYLLAFRLSDLKYFWFNHQFNLKIFDPTIYAESDYLPSLGDLLLNVLAITWLTVFIYAHRKSFRLPKWFSQNKLIRYVWVVLSILLLAAIAWLAENIFFGLVYNSKIEFNISNIIHLSWMSWLSIFILCLVWLNIYLITSYLADFVTNLKVSKKQQLVLFCSLIAIYSSYKLSTDFSIYYLIYALILFLIAFRKQYFNHITIWVFALIFLSMATISAAKYIKFEDIKERNQRVELAKRLMFEDDPKAINAINIFEKDLAKDNQIKSYFKQPLLTQTYNFHNYLSKKYLDGYLSRYEYQISEYDPSDNSLKSAESIPIEKYKNLVQSGAFKVAQSNYFYRVNDTFGYQNYFSLIPIIENNNLLGTLIIELKSKPFDYNAYFPDLLIDGKFKSDENLKKYALAFYKNDKLFSQSGNYIYPLENTNLKGHLNQVIFKNETFEDNLFSHAIYQPTNSKTIIISAEKMEYKVRLAILSFFFLIIILFAIISYIVLWLVINLQKQHLGWLRINRVLTINANKILYKTRIQFTIIFSVVATLVIIGWSTFFYIKQEYFERQKEQTRTKLRSVQNAFEKRIALLDLSNSSEEQAEFNQFADMNGVFVNVFDLNGKLFLTSLPKLYDSGIIGKQMAPLAFLELSNQKKSEYINTMEKIGTFGYTAAYAPIKNTNNKTIAYLSIPFYTNEAEYQEKIGPFINTLINIYALVFVLIGVFAVFLANQITEPLTFIEENIKRTKLGQLNKPIKWNRQDEIGVLIREYNKMISELELSAHKLAKSERESAWREMAQQVAHEIKNPLTPLKLGVQLLEKSWKENDPHFERKFKKFSYSFIEQIDSLAKIASEFSNFAKMPDTKLENIELFPIIRQAKDLFNASEEVEIIISNLSHQNIIILGDKDQLLRSFNNLFKNAIEAKSDHRPCIISIKIENNENQAFIEINDNGQGIDNKNQKDIFRPNFTTKSSGTGLGLAFVKQAVENTGGHIKFSSIKDEGTSFYLIFPLV